MYLVPIAWLYVALMMALAELLHPQGGWLGAIVTFVLYGVGPVALVIYLLGTPSRRRARKARDAMEDAAARAAGAAALATPGSAGPAQGDEGRHAAGDTVTPVRKEP